MKTVNAKIFAIKHLLIKKLNASLEKDKNAIKEGAKITFENYCKIQVVDCTKTTFDKDKIEAFAKKHKIDISTLQKTTNYSRIDIDNVPIEVDDKVNQILDTLEDDNDREVVRVASAVARQ